MHINCLNSVWREVCEKWRHTDALYNNFNRFASVCFAKCVTSPYMVEFIVKIECVSVCSKERETDTHSCQSLSLILEPDSLKGKKKVCFSREPSPSRKAGSSEMAGFLKTKNHELNNIRY